MLYTTPDECCDGRPMIAPGDPANSYLVNKIEGARLCGGQRMPLNLGVLSAADQAAIIGWICEGAPDN